MISELHFPTAAGCNRTRLRVLLFYPALAPYVVDLFNELGEKVDLRVVFLWERIYYHPGLDQSRLRELLTCEYDFIHGGFSVAGRRVCLGIWSEISNFRPDVVITVEYAFSSLMALLARHLGRRQKFGFSILTAENPRILQKRKGVRALLARICSNAADSIIVYTNEMKLAYAGRGLPSDKIFVCANHPSETCFLRDLEATREVAREVVEAHGLVGRKILLCVGRLAETKGLHRVIHAFSSVENAVPEAALVIAGDGPERSRLESLAAAEGMQDRVYFLGHLEQPQLLVWYLLSAALVLASSRECYGAVVAESLMAGAPVLCSSNAGAHVLIQNETAGGVFDPHASGELEGLIERTLRAGPTADRAAVLHRTNLMPVSFEQGLRSFIQAARYASLRAE